MVQQSIAYLLVIRNVPVFRLLILSEPSIYGRSPGGGDMIEENNSFNIYITGAGEIHDVMSGENII